MNWFREGDGNTTKCWTPRESWIVSLGVYFLAKPSGLSEASAAMGSMQKIENTGYFELLLDTL